jgi:thioredoxin-like negative regulator of GroEL
MNSQLWAVAVVGAIVLTATGLEAIRSLRARRRAIGATAAPAAQPYILYFTGESCTVCRTHQEPALAKLGDVRIDKVDAIADRPLADRFHVYTLPTTVVMSADGRALNVNYGYAPAPKLERQLADAKTIGDLRAAATA